RRAAAADRVPRGRSAPRRKQGAGPSSQRLLEDGQRQAAELEGPAMEVTGRGPGGLGLLAQPLPDPLTDLVGRRLPRPAQVAVQLEALLRLGHSPVGAHEVPGLLDAPGTAGGTREVLG